MSAELKRSLSLRDGVLLTIGSVVGSGIFLTSSQVASELKSPGLFLLVWVCGGLLTLTGALSYAELGVLFPKAGGLYHYLKESYGTLWGFLYGWTCFFVIMGGGIAAIATGFGQYFVSLFPSFLSDKLVACTAIVLLTAINHFGVRQGALTGNALVIGEILFILIFCAAGFFFASPGARPEPSHEIGLGTWSSFGIAMIAVFWAYDGWYGLTFSAGEMKNPARNLPFALILGSLVVMALYLLLNSLYLRALPVEEIAKSNAVGKSTALALFGPSAAQWFGLGVLLCILGCLACTILYSSRIYLPMARDGVFFHSMANIHPRFQTPVFSLWAQSLWAIALTLSGRFEQLLTYSVFAGVLFHALTAAAVFALRRNRPELERPYRVWGYPVVPGLFLLSCLILAINTAIEKPLESLIGCALIALGLPAYFFWKRQKVSPITRQEIW